MGYVTPPPRWSRILWALLGAAALAGPQPPASEAQPAPAKKIYISVDMEGIAGVADSTQLSAGQPEYTRYRALMAQDVNAAIRGARAGGATEIVVNDAHGNMRNLRLEDLEPGVRLISHSFKAFGMMEGLDESFDGVFFIGYHAKAGSPVGFAAHTGSGVIRDLRVNGRSVGEAGLNALLAAWYGVPVVFGTGDQVATGQILEAAPGARVVTVKRAINSRAVALRPLEVVRAEIAEAARAAAAAARRGTPQRAGPVRVEIQFTGTAIPEVAEGLPQIARPAPDTLAFSAETMPQAYRLIRILYRYLNPE